MKQKSLLSNELEIENTGPVECLGMTFENDEARRTHFTELLRDKLKDPEFKAIEGFPIGTDEAILELSDPPYYTACPNPWLNDFVELWESEKGYTDEDYHREPFAADVSEGKNDPIYNAHSYHTKVPHKAIMRYILHYTKPGDIVFDGFCGTGMTGVAAQMCGDKQQLESLGYRVTESGDVLQEVLDENGNSEWKVFSKLGARKAIVNDLSPAASFIASNYNKPVNHEVFHSSAEGILSSVEEEFGWMYETNHDENNKGRVNFTLWSDVLTCPDCSQDIIFWDVAVDKELGSVKDLFDCPSCNKQLSKKDTQKKWSTFFDPYTKELTKQVCQTPVLINYTFKGKRFEKVPDEKDLELINSCSEVISKNWLPVVKIPKGDKTSEPVRLGLDHVHHMYSPRNLNVLSFIRSKVFDDYKGDHHLGLWFTSSQVWGTKQNRLLTSNYFKKRGGVIGQTLQGTLYVSSLSIETNLIERFRLRKNSVPYSTPTRHAVVCNGSALNLPSIDDNSLDYVFIDPPFGSNLMYSELNILWESWLGLRTNNKTEAIENKSQNKGKDEYRELMASAFKEVYRVLKPSRWITVEFSNTKASIWNNIQTAINEAGFIVANVSALNKTHNSFNAVTNPTSVKQDLVISAYKPDNEYIDALNNNDAVEFDTVAFIRSHLKYLPVYKLNGNQVVKVPERDPRILFDQVISFCIRKGSPVPYSSPKFQSMLLESFIEKDGMIFLPEQAVEYEKKRALSSQVQQLSIFVDDEASAIEWMRQELKSKPKTYSEIHPLFLNELSGWKKSELALELSTLLEQNFIKYDGIDEVPSQIHTYLSTNFKDMRGLEKDDPQLKAKAKDRWYVPDPNKAADLEKVRLRALLREFDTYKEAKKKIKQPRSEALRAGFNAAWEVQDFQTILGIAGKIPPAVLQEDEKLLMFYDTALTMTAAEDDEW
ncbi:DNA methyltransferase [Vibrio parahaemolyticus]|uniref:DNA methyltransferase n=1 Tax=Vibrio parahaemolyticus TaxID=670 RepID=UPI001FACFD30|nr:DNA methyltransferase [Vibrio parahaemolyticus]MCI9689796.1 DNA methylase [Vibrio parahaemolyticus]